MEGRGTSASTLNADPPQVIKMNEKKKVIGMIRCECRPGLYVMYDGFVMHSPGWECPDCGQVV